jgi:hypothetical protein
VGISTAILPQPLTESRNDKLLALQLVEFYQCHPREGGDPRSVKNNKNLIIGRGFRVKPGMTVSTLFELENIKAGNDRRTSKKN